MCSDYLTLYIYFPCIREIWIFVHPRKVIFPEGNTWGKYDYFEGEHIFISHLCKGNECFFPPCQRFGEICWPSLFTKLIFRNISGVIPLYDQSVKSWEFRIREIRYCWEENTMLLRGKYMSRRIGSTYRISI